MKEDLSTVLAHLRENRDRHVCELEEFLRIPSISALSQHREDVERAARWLARRIKAAGFVDVMVDPTPGNPVVRGRAGSDPDRPTVLIYGHYDVQPVDPLELWQTPPFSPRVEEGVLYARGSSDDKGQVFLHVLAAEAWLQTARSLPVNLIVLFEGEEEIGSPHLSAYIEAHRSELAADWAVISDTPMLGPGHPSICYGLRGLAEVDLHVFGADRDLHSGVYGGAVANPAHALAELIASLHDPDGRVAVSGFYDDVAPLASAERAALAALPFDRTTWPQPAGEDIGEPGFSILERVWARPTVEVNGMWSGFTGEGRKTIVPASAHAKITCRLVPNQQPDRIMQAVRAHLEGRRPRGVRLEVELGGGDPGIVTPIDHPAVLAASQALEQVFGQPVAYIRMGGSIPVVSTFERVLSLPTVLIGFALPDENFHAPNEHFNLENFYRGTETIATLWGLLGRE